MTRLYMSAQESELLRNLAKHLCLVQQDGAEAFVSGDKNGLVALIVEAGRISPLATAGLLREAILDIPHQARADQMGSSITFRDNDHATWSELSSMTEVVPYKRPGIQVMRRLAAAAHIQPQKTIQVVRQILHLIPEPSDLEALYLDSLSLGTITDITNRLGYDAEQGDAISARTLVLWLIFLLTSMRRKEVFQLTFSDVHVVDHLTVSVRSPADPERVYLLHDPLVRHALTLYLDTHLLGTTHALLFPVEQWAFLHALQKYTEPYGISVGYGQLLGTYAALLRDQGLDHHSIRCHLVPVGQRITDVPLSIPS